MLLARPPGPGPANLSRSIRLFRLFRLEQTAPERFYQALAEDSVAQIGAWTGLQDRRVLDVGAGPGYFRDAFERAGAHYVGLDVAAGDLASQGATATAAVVGSGMDLPVRSGSVDVCYSSNVLEHVPRPWRMADELVRVTRPGGLIYLSFTVWYGPWGGHETSPWHYLGGRAAAERYARRHGRRPKNDFGRSLFRVDVRDALRWSEQLREADPVEAFPRYAPSWAFGVVRLPLLRELATWNLVLVLRKRTDAR